MTTNKNHHKESEESGRIMNPVMQEGNNGGMPGTLVFDGAELDFAATHLSRIKLLKITRKDVVLVAIPMREDCWLEVIDACIYAGADFILIDPVAEAASLTETIEREKVTVVAATLRVWINIDHQLNKRPGEIKTLRVICFDERGEPESHIHRVPSELNKQ